MTTPAPLPTDRSALLARLGALGPVDLAVIGGGATGLGVALDAAVRGFSVVLLEAHDFAKGTSSRATKLVHGGVRYLAQGNLALVREALHERATLLRNAPHLAAPIGFVMPAYRWWESRFYGLGLAAYDRLAGRDGLGRTRRLDRAATLRELPGAKAEGLTGGVLYWDGQFEDARLALALARTAAARGALVLNHVPVVGLTHEGGRVTGVRARDAETGREFAVRARAVVNATGVWVDAIRAHAGEGERATPSPLVAASQGVHLVVDRSFLPGDRALLVPSTADGRVLFAVPWLGHTVLGTTDTPRDATSFEPEPLAGEVAFILGEAGRYLARAPGREDVTSVWVGLRPLVRPQRDGADTKRISREHTIEIGPSGLVTVTGGKWTTYRAMAEDVLARCADAGVLERRPGGATARLRLVGRARSGADRRRRRRRPPGGAGRPPARTCTARARRGTRAARRGPGAGRGPRRGDGPLRARASSTRAPSRTCSRAVRAAVPRRGAGRGAPRRASRSSCARRPAAIRRSPRSSRSPAATARCRTERRWTTPTTASCALALAQARLRGRGRRGAGGGRRREGRRRRRPRMEPPDPRARSQRARRDRRDARGRPRPRQLPARRLHAVRDAGAVRDVRRRDPARADRAPRLGRGDAKTGACGSVVDLFAEPRLNHHATVRGGVLADESVGDAAGVLREEAHRGEGAPRPGDRPVGLAGPAPDRRRGLSRPARKRRRPAGAGRRGRARGRLLHLGLRPELLLQRLHPTALEAPA
jgi:glycerol-3-phosphate dehydrogenase